MAPWQRRSSSPRTIRMGMLFAAASRASAYARRKTSLAPASGDLASRPSRSGLEDRVGDSAAVRWPASTLSKKSDDERFDGSHVGPRAPGSRGPVEQPREVPVEVAADHVRVHVRLPAD